MEFPPFDHARFLAEGWSHGPPLHNLGASAFVPDDPLEGLPTELEASDVGTFDLHVATPYREAVAHHLGLEEEAVRPTAGTTAANTAAIAHAVRPGSTVVCERPYYAPLPNTAQGFGAELRFVDRTEGLDLDAMVAAIDETTSLVLLTSPNNPTGQVTSSKDLVALGEAAAEHGALVLVDQVYRELTDKPLAAGLHPALLSTGSFNKCWGAPGLRAGWIAGEPEVLEATEEIHRTLALGVSSPGARLATLLLEQADARRQAMDRRLQDNHTVYEGWCEDHGLEPAAGALTAFPKLPIKDTWAFATDLLAEGILTIPGEAFGKPGHVRLGLGVPTGGLRPALDALASRW